MANRPADFSGMMQQFNPAQFQQFQQSDRQPQMWNQMQEIQANIRNGMNPQQAAQLLSRQQQQQQQQFANPQFGQFGFDQQQQQQQSQGQGGQGAAPMQQNAAFQQQQQNRNMLQTYPPGHSRQLELMNMAQHQQNQNGPTAGPNNQAMRMQLAQQQQIRRQAGSPADLFSAPAPDALRRPSPAPPGPGPSMSPPASYMQQHLPQSPAQSMQTPQQQPAHLDQQQPAHLDQQQHFTPQATADKLREYQNKIVVLKASIEHEQKQLDLHRVQNRNQPGWTEAEQRHIQSLAAKNQMLPTMVDGLRGMAQQLNIPIPQNMGGHLANAHGQRPAPAQGWMGQGGTPSNPAQMQGNPGLSANHFPNRQPSPAHLPNQGMPQNGPPRTGPTPVQQPGQQPPNRPTPFAAQMQQFAQNGGQSATGPSSAPQQPGQPFSNMKIAPLERDRFENSFKNFCNSNNLKLDPTVINIDNRQVDLYALHSEVMKEGGEANVLKNDMWSSIGARMGFVHFPGSHQSAPGIAIQLQQAYTMYLSKFDGLYISSLERSVNRGLAGATLNQANNNSTPPNNTPKPMPNIGMGPSPGQMGGSTPFMQPNMMSSIITHAHQPVNVLRNIFRGNEQIVQYIENNRTQLLQRQQEQGSFRLALRAQPQNGQGPQQQQPPAPPQTGMAPSAWNLQAGDASNNPPSAPQAANINETFNIPQPPPEAQLTIGGKPGMPPQLSPDHPMIKQHIQILVAAAPKVRSHYQSRLNGVSSSDIPMEQRPQFKATLDQLLKLVHEFEQRLAAYSYIYMNNMPVWNKITTMAVLIRHQDHLLRSPYSRYLMSLERLTTVMQELSQTFKQFMTFMNVIQQSQQQRQQQMLSLQQQQPHHPPNQPPAGGLMNGAGGSGMVQPSINVPPNRQPTPAAPPQHASPPQAAALPAAPNRPINLQPPPKTRKPSTSTHPNANANAPSPAAPSPGGTATTPAASATAATPSSPTKSSPRVKNTKAKAPRKGKASVSAPVPEPLTEQITAPSPAAGGASTNAQASTSAPSSSKKRQREEEPAVEESKAASTSSAPALAPPPVDEPSPPKKAKTEPTQPTLAQDDSVTSALRKKEEAIESFESGLDANKFLEEMATKLGSMAGSGQDANLMETFDMLLKNYSVPSDVNAQGSSMDALGLTDGDAGSSSAAGAAGLAGNDDLIDFFDFSSFGADYDDINASSTATKPPPTPDLVSSSSTNPSPESNNSSDDHNGNSGGDSSIKIEQDDIGDPFRLGIWKEIDGGESAFYHSSEWKWDGPMPTLDQPWAISTS